MIRTLEILFESSRDKPVLMSAHIGERLSTAPLLKAHPIIFEDTSPDDASPMIALIREFLVAVGQRSFKKTVKGHKKAVQALADEAVS
jgi:hypothetical protein